MTLSPDPPSWADESLPISVWDSSNLEIPMVNFPPEFWDSLPPPRRLTKGALREVARQIGAVRPREPSPPDSIPYSIVRYSRHGGPDLSDLRGVKLSYVDRSIEVVAPSYLVEEERQDRTESDGPSTIYDDNFGDFMIDNHIYPPSFAPENDNPAPEPTNLNFLREVLSRPRQPQPLDRFSQTAFSLFSRPNRDLGNGRLVDSMVFAVLSGERAHEHSAEVHFDHFTPLVPTTGVRPKPGYFDGADQKQMHPNVRWDLGHLIIPKHNLALPVVPNFFMESRYEEYYWEAAVRRMVWDGAFGARAMHALLNYREAEPIYNGEAYTITCRYNANQGALHMYAHHLMAPPPGEERPRYYATKMCEHRLTSGVEPLREAVDAFRNARDFCRRMRYELLQAAASRVPPEANPWPGAGEEGEDEGEDYDGDEDEQDEEQISPVDPTLA